MYKFAPPLSQNRASRNAERRRQAAERSRRYREKIAQEGLPTAREVDQALSEAMAFVTRRCVVVNGRPLIDLGDIVTTAALILKRSGKNKAGSLAAVRDRIAHRDEHTGPSWMPSTRPKGADLLLPPARGNRWSARDVIEIRAVMDRHARRPADRVK